MRRRDLLALTGFALGLPASLGAEPPSDILRRIGYLGSGTAAPLLLDVYRRALSELGRTEGRDIDTEFRFADGRDDRLPALAAELVRRKVEIIVASPTPAVLAAKGATKTIPIVAIGFDNPVENGLVASLARPGGNVTGLSYGVGPEIFGKHLELVRELIPDIKKFAVLSNSEGPNHALMINNIRSAARSLRIELLVLDARGPDEFDAVFAAMEKARVGAVFVFGDPMFGVHRVRLAELAANNRLPSMYTNRLHVEAGGLMCYGPNFVDLWRRAAVYVDKILKGAKPADLPVEQPTKFELVINLKTANSLGLAVPPPLLARADAIID